MDENNKMPELRDLTPEQLKASIDNYFRINEAKGEFPDYAGLLVYLNNAEEEDVIEACEASEEIRKLFAYAKKKRESWLVRRMTRDNKMAAGCMNALSQPINGGYSKKEEKKNDKKIIIDIRGVGGEEACK